MAARKIAISLLPETLDEIDRAAAEEGTTRSAFIARICMLAARARSDREMRRRINEIFADPEIRKEQVETARALRRIGRSEGTEW